MLIWREKTRRWLEEIEKWRWVIAVLCGAVVMMPAHAQSMHSTTALTNGASASSAYAGSTLWLSREVAGFGTQYLSGIRMGPNWGITAAHAFVQGDLSLSDFRLGTGSNYLTDRGMERSITSFVTHPLSYPPGFDGNEVDLAVFFWSGDLPGTTPTIAPAVLGEVLSYNGFGRPATPSLGVLPADGQRRMFQTYADAFGFGIASSDYVAGIFFDSGLGSLPLGGVATSGNSGSGVYNSAGELVAMTVAGSGSPGYLGTTFSLRLDLYEPWINTVVPAPGTAALLVLSGVLTMRRRRM